MRNKFSFLKSTAFILSMTMTVLFLFPVVWMLFVSVKVEGTAIVSVFDWFKPPFTFHNYIYVIWNSPIMQWMWNSIVIAVISTGSILFLTSLAAYALSKFNFKLKNFMFFFFLAGLMIPLESKIIPLFITVKYLYLLDTMPGIILPGLATSMNIIILKGFFDGIPNDLFESAKIDGASNFTMYSRIAIPLAKPALATTGIFTFVGSWNRFLWPYLCVMSEKLFTLPVGIPTFNANYSVDYIRPMTVNAIASIPIIIVFFIFEKQIVKGITLSGLKG